MSRRVLVLASALILATFVFGGQAARSAQVVEASRLGTAVLVSVSASPVSVAAGGTVVVSIHLTDAGTSISEASVCYFLPNGTQAPGCQGPQIGPDSIPMTLASGTGQDGIWTASIAIPLAAASGTWTVMYVSSRDGTGISMFIAPNSVLVGGSFTVTGTNDVTPPAILSVTGPTSPVPVGQTFTISAHITDASGVAAAVFQVFLNTPSSTSPFYAASLASGSAQDGIWQVTLVATFSGQVVLVGAQDLAGNYGQIQGFPLVSFQVTGQIVSPTTLTYTGSTSGDFHDPATVSAHLSDVFGHPVVGVQVQFTLNSTETCTATTDAFGNAACTITPGGAAGSYTVTADFAGNANFSASHTSAGFAVAREETVTHYTGPVNIANGRSVTLSAVLKEDNSQPIAGRIITFILGTGGSAQSCTGTTDASGTASCAIPSVNQPLGPGTVSASFARDAFYLPSSERAITLVFQFLSSGSFVVGDKSASLGSSVYYWGAQWANNNSLSGGGAPNSFKGFADSTSRPPACGQPWTTDPGNSSGPPATVPSFMAVIVSSSVDKSWSTISGMSTQMVIVQTDPGFGPNSGHPGTGKVIAVLSC